MVVSSRKKDNVSRATDALRSEGINAKGVVCHVSKPEDRDNLIDFVSIYRKLSPSQLSPSLQKPPFLDLEVYRDAR